MNFSLKKGAAAFAMVGLCIKGAALLVSVAFGFADLGFGLAEMVLGMVGGIFGLDSLIEAFGVTREFFFEIMQVGVYTAGAFLGSVLSMVGNMDEGGGTVSTTCSMVSVLIVALMGVFDVGMEMMSWLPIPFLGVITSIIGGLGEFLFEILQAVASGAGYVVSTIMEMSGNEGGQTEEGGILGLAGA